MEATKERKEETEKKSEDKKDPMGKAAREVIRESIITKADCDGNGGGEADQNDNNKQAKKPDDVLAYSRTVHHTDSSLK